MKINPKPIAWSLASLVIAFIIRKNWVETGGLTFAELVYCMCLFTGVDWLADGLFPKYREGRGKWK